VDWNDTAADYSRPTDVLSALFEHRWSGADAIFALEPTTRTHHVRRAEPRANQLAHSLQKTRQYGSEVLRWESVFERSVWKMGWLGALGVPKPVEAEMELDPALPYDRRARSCWMMRAVR